MLSQRAAGRRVDPGLLILLLEAARFEGSVDAAQLSLKLLTALDSQGAHAMAGLAGVGELRRGRPLAVKVPQRAREVLVQVLLGADMLHENLEELGLGDIAISKLRAALFPEANDNDDDDDDGLQLEENANEKVVEKAVPSGSPPTPPVAPAAPAAPLPANFPAAPPADVLPNDLPQEEIDAAEVGCGCG